MKKYIILILFITFGCAKSTSVSNPNAFYYFAFQKYYLSVNQFVSWTGLFFVPGIQKFTFNYQSTEFSCRGLATYQPTTINFFPTTDGETISVSGTLLEPTGSCFQGVIGFDIKRIGLDPYAQPYYELTLSAERYYIKTN